MKYLLIIEFTSTGFSAKDLVKINFPKYISNLPGFKNLAGFEPGSYLEPIPYSRNPTLSWLVQTGFFMHGGFISFSKTAKKTFFAILRSTLRQL